MHSVFDRVRMTTIFLVLHVVHRDEYVHMDGKQNTCDTIFKFLLDSACVCRTSLVSSWRQVIFNQSSL